MRHHDRPSGPSRPRGVRRLVAGLALALGLTGLAACAKSEDTEKDFDAWLADHPVPGATLDRRSATDSIMGAGELTVYYELTARPTERSLRRAMAGACGFDGETKAATAYWLEVGTRTLEVACRGENQRRVARFWSATRDLDVRTLTLRQDGVDVTVDRTTTAVADGVLDRLTAAGRSSGLRLDNGFRVTGDGAAFSVTPGADGSPAELAAIRRLAGSAGDALDLVTSQPGEVIAGTHGTVEQARRWEDGANGSSRRVLVVGSLRTTWLQLPTRAERDLVDRVAVRPLVRHVTVRPEDWTVDVVSAAGARSLVTALRAPADAPALADLGDLQAKVVAASSSGTAAAPSTCTVALALPDATAGLRLLDACAVPGVEVGVDTTPGTTDGPVRHDLRVSPDGLAALMRVLRDLPDGTPLEIRKDAPPYSTAQVTTGDRLSATGDDRAWVRAIGRAWQRAG